MKRLFVVAMALAASATSLPAAALDAAAADALVRKSKCLTCHAVDKKKDGPAFKETAGKYKGKPEAMEKLTKHVTVPSKVKVEGKEEDHETLKTEDPAAVKNVVEWILSL
ncbi:MAG: cytochrome c [Azoarcus sp.]|uniref:Cytochrome c n=1 Tax=Aromatoleum tolulyticum TaxID=34027 RepID=A0A1N6X877_9RHOO|nr:c-type cytochrome [Aromatoleum tolulyticum]MCK9986036.1 cytochrome c [Azoarcus sp.]SIQ98487.1 cytochrome c [Aromatoleum tolulyticum]